MSPLFGSPTQKLVAGLKHKDPAHRASSAAELARLRDANAVDPLIACLKDGSPAVRESAAKALAMIGEARALRPMIDTLGMDFASAPITKNKVVAALSLAQKHKDEQAVGEVIALLKREDTPALIKFAVIGALVDFVGPLAIPPIIEMFKDRLYADIAGQLIVEKFGSSARPFLLAASESEDARIREKAVKYLAQL